MEYRPKVMLVTGGAGFIGSNFVRHLLKTDQQVKILNLDLLTYAGSADNLNDLPDPQRHTLIQGDICDRPSDRTAACASITSTPSSISPQRVMWIALSVVLPPLSKPM